MFLVTQIAEIDLGIPVVNLEKQEKPCANVLSQEPCRLVSAYWASPIFFSEKSCAMKSEISHESRKQGEILFLILKF